MTTVKRDSAAGDAVGAAPFVVEIGKAIAGQDFKTETDHRSVLSYNCLMFSQNSFNALMRGLLLTNDNPATDPSWLKSK